MSDLPILFSAPMVRAILREIEQPGTGKTQTRRILGKTGHCNIFELGVWADSYVLDPGNISWRERDTPYAVRDRLWVRESWRCEARYDALSPAQFRSVPIYYAADPNPRDSEPGCAGRLRASMHMPRWASRLTLIVEDVRVQRLQEISEEDAIAEGVECDSDGWRDYLMPATQCCASAKDSYRTLWGSINGEKHPWSSNPWIVAVTFRPILGNIDLIGSTP